MWNALVFCRYFVLPWVVRLQQLHHWNTAPNTTCAPVCVCVCERMCFKDRRSDDLCIESLTEISSRSHRSTAFTWSGNAHIIISSYCTSQRADANYSPLLSLDILNVFVEYHSLSSLLRMQFAIIPLLFFTVYLFFYSVLVKVNSN